MTKVATAGELPISNALHFGGVSVGGGGPKSCTTRKRKTPSELRGEILKRKNMVELVDESVSITSLTSNADGAVSGPKKSDSSKVPRFRRMDEHFPVTKTSRLLSRIQNLKENFPSKGVSSEKNSSLPMDLNAKHQAKHSWDDTVSPEDGNNSSDQANNTNRKCPSHTFKSVMELSMDGTNRNGSAAIDMGKALKGLVSRDPHSASSLPAESIDRAVNLSPNFCSEFHIPGYKVPLDLTLKTNMRLLSSSPVDWFHRLTNSATLNGMDLSYHVGRQGQSMTSSHETASTSQIEYLGTLHSWVHPQSVLPHAVISALNSVPGGQMDFLNTRQHAWEDSFRSLYYMLRKKTCKLFYVCSAQFVVMFAASDGPDKTKHACYAYVSQSTQNLRSLLKEHDVSFSMPLCYSKVEEVTAEDIVALSEIEKHNLGQTRATESLTGFDNTPQSLLLFTGNRNVHALYDLLLNYRSFFMSLTGGDVPVLYSPVPFKNAALTAPEVRCKQVRRVDYMSSQLNAGKMDGETTSSSAGMCYSVEIKDAYIPPWVICGISNAMRSHGSDFQASFVTVPTSIGLNVGLEIASNQPSLTNAEEPLQQSGDSFGIPNTTLSLQRHPAYLKGFKYGGGSYTAFLSPVG